MTFLPATYVYALLGFVLFRLFDIFKPWPISWLDKNIGGGLGIMIDDVVAGLAAAAVIVLLQSTNLL
jgi:phosphatidylglycerophosphatase A